LRGRSRALGEVNLNWILLGLLGWGLGFLCVVVLMRASGKQHRAARRDAKRVDPLADVTITQTGGPSTGGR
jgi:hypothetical protein